MEVPKLPIDQVLEFYGTHVPPRRRGWTKISCPVHSENTPSATVNVELGRINCFSCGFRGDGLDLIREKEGCDLRAAIEFAEGKAWADSSALSPAAAEPRRLRPLRLSDRGPGAQPGGNRPLPAGGRPRPRRRRLADG